MLNVTLPAGLKSFAQREFIGESLRWAHTIAPRSAIFPAFGLWLFAVPWTAFTVFWESMAVKQFLSSTKPGWGGLIMVFWGIPFVAIGLFMMSAPYWAWRHAKNSVWVLTNTRLALLTAQRKAVKIRSIVAGDILSIERTENEDGSGALTLHYQSTRDSDGDRKERSDTIHGIASVREVEAMIRAMRSGEPR